VASKTFAAALKAAREGSGLSQAALARKAGLTGSYVSVLESRRKRPPSARVVHALARAMGIDDQELQELAGIERSPDGVRRRLERLDREHGRAVATRDRILTTALLDLAHRPGILDPMAASLDLDPSERALLGRLVGRVRRAGDPDAMHQQAGEILESVPPKEREALASVLPRVLEGARDAAGVAPVEAAGEPATVPPPLDRRVPVRRSSSDDELPREWLEVDPRHLGPDRWLLRVSSDDAWPRVEPGDLLLVDPHARPRAGDLVVVPLAAAEAGRDAVRAYQEHGDEVRLLSPRPDVPPLRRPAARPGLAGVVCWIYRELR
jgi:transcriptional regulator with XRE-family HTH domain